MIYKIIHRIINSKYFLEAIDIKRLETKLNSFKIARNCERVIMGSESRFYPESEVFNLQKSKDKIRIGNNCHIRGELFIYPYGNGIEIGDNSYLGKYSIVRAANKIVIGNNVLIAHCVTIIDTDSHEINYVQRKQGFREIIEKGHPTKPGEIKTAPIIIEDDVWINHNVAILKGLTISRGAIIGAGSVVTKDVPSFTLVAGNPAKVIKELPH